MINLKLSEKNDPAAQNYLIHIKMFLDALINQQITSIAKKHRLEVKKENGEVILSLPKEF